MDVGKQLEDAIMQRETQRRDDVAEEIAEWIMKFERDSNNPGFHHRVIDKLNEKRRGAQAV